MGDTQYLFEHTIAFISWFRAFLAIPPTSTSPNHSSVPFARSTQSQASTRRSFVKEYRWGNYRGCVWAGQEEMVGKLPFFVRPLQRVDFIIDDMRLVIACVFTIRAWRGFEGCIIHFE